MSMYVPDFQQISSSLSLALSMAKGFLTLRNEADRQQMVIDLQAKILEAQEDAVRSYDSYRDLERHLLSVQEELERLKSQRDVVATMARKAGFCFLPSDAEPCCSRCAEVDFRVVHLLRAANVERRKVWRCPHCKSEVIDWGES